MKQGGQTSFIPVVHEGTEAQVQATAVLLLYTPQSAWPPKWWHTEISSFLFGTGCLGTRMDHMSPQVSARQSVATPSQPGMGGGGPGWHRGAGRQRSTAANPKLHLSLRRAPHNLGTHGGLLMTWGRTRWAGPVLPASGPPGLGMGQI